MEQTKNNSGTKGGRSGRGRGWFGDSEGHARAGAKSSGNRTTNRGRGRTSSINMSNENEM